MKGRNWNRKGNFMKKCKKIFWGVFFIVAAVLIVAGNFWDIAVLDILILLGMMVLLIEGILHGNFALILFPAAIVFIRYKERLGLYGISPWSILAAALFGSIGLSVLFPNRKWFHISDKRFHRSRFCYRGSHGGGAAMAEEVGNENGRGAAEEEIVEGKVLRLENDFGDTVKYISSKALSEVHMDNSFGNMVVYFNNAELMNHHAKVHVHTSFGNVVLHVPASWKVKIHGNTTFSRIEEKGQCNPEGENILEVRGDVSFGALQIKYIENI